MGMALIGSNPSSEKGRDFDCTVWAWEEILGIMRAIYPEMWRAHGSNLHYNQGYEVLEYDCLEFSHRLAELLRDKERMEDIETILNMKSDKHAHPFIDLFRNKKKKITGIKSPYTILNLKHGTTSKSKIKSAYRRAAMKWHPDKNPDPEATNMMKKINMAYRLLKSGKYKERDDSDRMSFDREMKKFLKEFIVFLRHCGGFRIW